jgi:hypothetical protein
MPTARAPRGGYDRLVSPGPLGTLGRMLLGVGALLALVGVLLILAERFPGLRIGRLPGDVAIERGRWRLYFPLGTSILLSVVLTLLFWLFGRRG